MPPLRLEVFRTADDVSSTIVTDITAIEEEKLAAYENGYKAGWEDAANAQADDQARLSADLAHNLQSLGFTYHEARGHVLRAIAPLLQSVVSQLLPEIAKATLSPIILETLLPIAEDLGDTPVTLVFNPVARPALQSVLEQASGLPLTLCEEPTLGEGQVYLRLGDVEVDVNLDRAIDEIASALNDFLQVNLKENTHG